VSIPRSESRDRFGPERPDSQLLIAADAQPSKVKRHRGENADDDCEAWRPGEVRSRRVFGRDRFTCRDMTRAQKSMQRGIIPIIRI
jgi:hypothetical protein